MKVGTGVERTGASALTKLRLTWNRILGNAVTGHSETVLGLGYGKQRRKTS